MVGAGPAGASAANALCLGGVRDVALIDRARFPRDKVCGDGITEGAVDVLKEFDLGHLLAPHALISRVVVTAPSGAQAAMEPVAANRRSALPMSSPAKYSVLASYLSQLGGDFDLYQASVHSAPLPLASRLPRLALPAQSAALIGDAASMINPLTGEGISYGMVAGLLLGRELADAVRQGQDLGPAALRYEKDFRARFSAHFRNNVALRGILRFRPLVERMVRSYRRDAGYYRDALEFMLGCGNAVSVPRLFWRGLVPS